MIYSYLIVLRPPGRFLYKKNGKLYNVLIPKKLFFIKFTPKRPSPNWGAFLLTKNNDSAIINYPDILFLEFSSSMRSSL